ncbi:MAG: Uma2 family endonuclease [Bacteroidetes bacterium]|jgi:Uma2 family endonuclease|nr:Uma2 family endonuclease [Bacteroidota bacterium]
MNAAEKNLRVSANDYLIYLDSIEGRAEFYDGQIFDMAGGSNNHSKIGVNCSSALLSALSHKDCSVYGADANLAIDAANAIVMPDVHVVCGDEKYSNQNSKIHTNAIVVVEVLSPSTGLHDRGGKFHIYMKIPTLQEYVLIDQFQPQVDVLRRSDTGFWLFQSYSGMEEVIHLASLDIDIPLSSIYAKVKFDPNPDIAIKP